MVVCGYTEAMAEVSYFSVSERFKMDFYKRHLSFIASIQNQTHTGSLGLISGIGLITKNLRYDKEKLP